MTLMQLPLAPITSLPRLAAELTHRSQTQSEGRRSLISLKPPVTGLVVSLASFSVSESESERIETLSQSAQHRGTQETLLTKLAQAWSLVMAGRGVLRELRPRLYFWPAPRPLPRPPVTCLVSRHVTSLSISSWGFMMTRDRQH